MNTQNFQLAVVLTLCLSILHACQKDEDNFSTSIIGVHELQHDQATLDVEYDLGTYTNYLSGGLYLATDGSPDVGDLDIEKNNIKTGEYQFYLEDLHGNFDYTAKSYLTVPGEGQSSLTYSGIYNFHTPQSPPASCGLGDNEMKLAAYSATTWVLDPMQETPGTEYYTYKVTSSLGTIYLEFIERPLSGIYNTVDSNSWLEDFQVHIYGYLSGTWTCYYGVGNGYDVLVRNDGNGGLEFTFCDINFGTAQSCTPNYTISAKMVN